MEDLRKVLGERIRSTRVNLGFSQEELARKAGFPSHQIISQIENGDREVKAWELAKIAEVLYVNISVFLSKEPRKTPVAVLWRDKPREKTKEREARFLQRCREYAELEELCNVKCRYVLPQFEVNPKTIDFKDTERMAEDVARKLQLGAHPAASLEKTLENQYGVKIWYEDLGGEVSGASTIGDFGPAILMNRNQAPWRRNYNFAHEVFHLVTLRSLHVELLEGNTKLWEKVEKLANAFASHLLLPADVVRVSFYERVVNNKIAYSSLVELAREFDVSTEALLYRLYGIRLVSKGTVDAALKDESFRKLDRATMPVCWWDPPPLPQRFVQLAFMAYQKGDLSRAKLAKYLDTSLFDLSNRLLEYGLDDTKNYQTEVPAARRQHCD